MKNDLTELVFILDKSGSMSGLESDTIGGYNSLLTKQRKEPGEAIVTTVLFDNEYELLHDRINIKGIKPLTEKEYVIGGSTALLDAMGKTINKLINVQKNTLDAERAAKVMFTFITDGMENASREYAYPIIKKMIEQQKEMGWEFLFLGANIDAVETAEKFGIQPDRAVTYQADSKGTQLNYKAVNEAVSNLRASMPISSDWKQEIEQDFKKRNKK